MSDPRILRSLATALREHAPVVPGLESHLRAVLDDATGSPGRLLRARLVNAAARRHGLPEPAALRLATAVEYFHLASLLLDDLPCMDDALERRGRPCPHLAHGEATVILAALALVNRAHVLVGFLLPGYPPELRPAVLACLDSCLGTAGVIGGQAEDLRERAGVGTARATARIALRKTGALIHLSVLLPALLGASRREEFRRLKSLCVYWGLAYQLADDLADQADAATLDEPNLARQLGPAAAQARLARLRRLAQAAVSSLVRLDPRWDYLAEFAALLLPPATSQGQGVAA